MERINRNWRLSACLLMLSLAGCASPAIESSPVATQHTQEAGLPTSAAPARTATASPTLEPGGEPSLEAQMPTSEPQKSPWGPADADVEFVRAQLESGGAWTFSVTVRHPDKGWEDYADGWDVLTLDGVVLKPNPDSPFTRLLLHPHENEQPFTRSQGGVQIPQGVTQVRVRAHDLVSGFGGREVLVDLTVASGPGFEIIR